MFFMTNSERQRPRRFFSATLANAMLVGAVASAALLTACESAVDRGAADRGSASYNESILARSILQNTYHGDTMQDPTIAQGVRELPRVDSAGPAATTDAAVAPATVSVTATTNADSPATAPDSAVPVPASQPVVAGDAPLPSDPLAAEDLGNTSEQANQAGLSAATLNAPEKVVNLSLQDAIARTLKNALDIKAQAYDPGIKEALEIQQEALFDPVIFGSAQLTDTDEPQTQQVFNSTYFTTDTNQIGIRKLLPDGGTAQVSSGVTYYSANPAISGSLFGHYYEPNLNATFTQPLLRGFGTGVTEANLYLAQRDHRISLETFRRQVITSVSNVEEAYQNLVLARTTVDIQEQLLAATEDTYKRVHDRILVDADQISVNQAIAAVEQRRAELISDRIQLRASSDELKRLINDPELNITENMLINPSDKPVSEPIVFSTAESIETALHERTELQEDRIKLEKADIILSVAKNDLLPKLDLTASIQTTGLGGDLDAAFGSTVTPGQHIDYNAGVRLEIPIGNRNAEGEVRQRKLERNQLLTQTVKDAQDIVADVKKQLRELLGRYQELQSRERSRISAAKELKAITDKEKIVALTPEFLQLKLDAQASLAQAEQTLIQAIVNYNLAIERLERAKGTLLEFDRISLDRAPIARPEDDNGKLRFLDKTYTLTK
jgi:outer membrane protein TolC